MPEFGHRDRFLACRTCRRLERILPCPAELEGEDESFTTVHAGHRLEPLIRNGDAFLSDRPAWDPLATTYFEVTNGQEILVVRSARSSIEAPLERVLLPGRLRLDSVSVDFEIDLIRRAIDAHFFPQALRPAKLDRFVAALGELRHTVDPERLDIVFDSAEEPQVQFARLPESLYRQLRQRADEIFDSWERERLNSFFETARGDDGLLCLRLTRSFVVEAA
jgi:hypothetical protein